MKTKSFFMAAIAATALTLTACGNKTRNADNETTTGQTAGVLEIDSLLAHAGQIIELGGGGRNLWAARLDEAVRLTERPVILVAHGIGCFAVTWWARLSPAPLP